MANNEINVVAACLVGGFTLIASAIRRRKRLNKVQDTPMSKISSAAQGFVELQGFAWPRTGAVKTLKGFDVVYYVLVVEQKHSRGSGKRRRTEWVQVYRDFYIKPFYVLDGSGVAEVYPGEMESEIGSCETRTWEKLSEAEMAECALRVRGVHGFPPVRGILGLFGGNFRVKETYITVGSPVFVSGDFRSDSGEKILVEDGALSSFARKVIDHGSRSFKNVSRFLDQNSDGQVSEAEARLGYGQAASAALRNPDKQPQPIQFFGRLEQSENHNLFISDMHERHLHDRLGRFLWLRLAGGSALTAIGVILALRMFIPDQALDNWASYVFSRSPAAVVDSSASGSNSDGRRH